MIAINWDKVDKLLEAGCDGVQIAAYFGCHPETLYDRCKQDQKTDFSEYKAQKRAKGDSKLLTAQYDAAINDKDKSMLIWLGKQRLNQTDKSKQEIDIPQMRPVIITPDGKAE